MREQSAKNLAFTRLPRLRVTNLPKSLLFSMGMAMVQRRRRSLAHDQRWALSVLQPEPEVSGLENIPRDGSFALVANHYQNPNLWIGYPGCLIGDAIYRMRPDIDPPVHWLVTNSYHVEIRGRQYDLPFVRWAFTAVAYTYHMVPHELNADRSQHAVAMRKILQLLTSGTPAVVGIFPEGITGDTAGLHEALPGTGLFLYHITRKGIPVVPCGVWTDETQRMHARFGPAVTIAEGKEPGAKLERSVGLRDEQVRTRVMQALACLLPARLRGVYTAVRCEQASEAATEEREQAHG